MLHFLMKASLSYFSKSLIFSGLNPSEEEVMLKSNEIWDGSDKVTWPAFASVLSTMLAETAGVEENRYKETFRVFSKNEKGAIPMEEMKFVLSNVCSEQVWNIFVRILKMSLYSGDRRDCVSDGQEWGRIYKLHRV